MDPAHLRANMSVSWFKKRFDGRTVIPDPSMVISHKHAPFYMHGKVLSGVGPCDTVWFIPETSNWIRSCLVIMHCITPVEGATLVVILGAPDEGS